MWTITLELVRNFGTVCNQSAAAVYRQEYSHPGA
jgi:hypothetical protein